MNIVYFLVSFTFLYKILPINKTWAHVETGADSWPLMGNRYHIIDALITKYIVPGVGQGKKSTNLL